MFRKNWSELHSMFPEDSFEKKSFFEESVFNHSRFLSQRILVFFHFFSGVDFQNCFQRVQEDALRKKNILKKFDLFFYFIFGHWAKNHLFPVDMSFAGLSTCLRQDCQNCDLIAHRDISWRNYSFEKNFLLLFILG